MDRRCIVICDSGVGGLGLLKSLSTRLKGENFVYFADYDNLPYGEKSAEKLFEIAKNNCKKFLSFSPKLIVFACNTLSTNSVGLNAVGGVRIVKVLPKVKSSGKGLLLCTEATAKSSYVLGLKNQNPFLDLLPMPTLAKDVEDFFTFGKKIDFKRLFLGVEKNYDFISLGCTHYTAIKNCLEKVFPNCQFLSGEEVVFDKVVNFITTFDTEEDGGEVAFVGRRAESVKSLYFKGFL